KGKSDGPANLGSGHAACSFRGVVPPRYRGWLVLRARGRRDVWSTIRSLGLWDAWLSVVRGLGWPRGFPFLFVIVPARRVIGVDGGRLAADLALDEREDGGQHDQRGEGRGGETADDRAAERCRLLPALAPARRHRHHAGDHGATRH